MAKLSRRALLAAPALLLPHAAVAHAAWRLDPHDVDTLKVCCEGVGEGVSVPAARARIAGVLPIAGRDVAAIAFGADRPGIGLDLLALVGWDDRQLRLLGLEILICHVQDGATIASRISSVGDQAHLRIARDAAWHGSDGVWRHEAWIDLLLWHAAAPLAESPVRPPPAGTWQSRLAENRAHCAALLATPCTVVTSVLCDAVAQGLYRGTKV